MALGLRCKCPVLADGAFQLCRTAMGAAFDLTSANEGEPALDTIEPIARSGREMHVKSRMTSEPTFDRSSLVCAVVVQDQMDIEFRRGVGFDGAQERKEFVAAMTPMQLSDHAPSGDIQRREQTRRAMALVVMRAPLGQARVTGGESRVVHAVGAATAREQLPES